MYKNLSAKQSSINCKTAVKIGRVSAVRRKRLPSKSRIQLKSFPEDRNSIQELKAEANTLQYPMSAPWKLVWKFQQQICSNLEFTAWEARAGVERTWRRSSITLSRQQHLDKKTGLLWKRKNLQQKGTIKEAYLSKLCLQLKEPSWIQPFGLFLFLKLPFVP